MVETEYNRRRPASFYMLQTFVAAQLFWDPDRDLEELIDIFCRGFYGNAAPEFADVPRRVGEGQTIIDFVRISNSRTVLGVYEGICWSYRSITLSMTWVYLQWHSLSQRSFLTIWERY